MKKFFHKKSVFIISIIFLIWIIFFIVDYNCAKKNKSPIFSIKINSYLDGGTTEYLGLGYKIIKYRYFDHDYVEFQKNTKNLYIPGPKEPQYVEYSDIGTIFLKIEKKKPTSKKEMEIENPSGITNEEEVKKIINSYIGQNLNKSFDPKNYKIETSSSGSIYVNYVFCYEDIKTDLGYMITINPNGKITLYDNMTNENEEEISKKINQKIIEDNPFQDEKIARAKEHLIYKAKKDNPQSTIDILDEYDFYYSKNDKFYHIIHISITAPDKTITQSFYDEQLN